MSVSDRDLVRQLGPVGHAFFGRFHALRDVQRHSIVPILSGKNVLVSSATASGKTEAVFAPLVARLQSLFPTSGNTIRVLAVAPTRALVNDLHARLERPLVEVRWSCGRQTSDHRDKYRCPDVLLTTPESFDSMLVRDSVREEGILKGHLLASVEAIFLDEVHLLQSSPRGDQVSWLLGRLRRLREYALRMGWTASRDLQICAASATVPDPRGLARKLLGEPSEVVLVSGNRELEILGGNQDPPWIRLEELNDIEAIYQELLFTNGSEEVDSVVRYVWRAIERRAADTCRKLLVFVPSRALCDRLSLALHEFLKPRRDIFVGAHHGSLERGRREHAEREFSRNRDAVLVATTTLEVGIDIGDVDAVVLVGAPPDTSSLLQRVGRAGRRVGCVRVVPLVRSPLEGRAISSMLEAACRGDLDPSPTARLWSVFVQQAASHIFQVGTRGRSRADLIALAQDVWPECEGSTTATRILDYLVEQDILVESGDRLHLGADWSDRFERAGGDVHHNFEAEGQGLPVVDASTGEVLAYVSEAPSGSTGIALAGQRWDVVSESGEVLLKTSLSDRGEETFRYAARAAPTGKSFAEHVRRGLGLGATDSPLIYTQRGPLWFHFGGSACEIVLRSLLPNLGVFGPLRGVALRGGVDEQTLRSLSQGRDRLESILREFGDTLIPAMSLGRYHRFLPEDIRSSVALELFDITTFAEWLRTRTIRLIAPNENMARKLAEILGDTDLM